ncbi:MULTISPECIES: glycoside hydrolase family 88 protein [unclassified Sphingobacterium]|uniref:glycoside hydrolase family 88/105 protein n=1 Tax=unclassified Sphingobacterium TaxID=2609468 RepID=UPI0025EDD41E|nr:glycoside hydrolase family 88 protein [Sphingobacterium sp. UBA5670]
MRINFILCLLFIGHFSFGQIPKKEVVLSQLKSANRYWQSNHKPEVWAFWDQAAYHTGNMEFYKISGSKSDLKYSEDWARFNGWKGAKSTDRQNWKYSYGETDDYVLFGDWQICFQTYIDLYNLSPSPEKIARAKEVMDYQIHSPHTDYWWWADGLYMVMPVMTKMYKLTQDSLYLDRMYTYLSYADSIMFDKTDKLYYRDAKYVYPKHKSLHGKKDFWARGDGWVFAALAKVLQDLPKQDKHYDYYHQRFKEMAVAIISCQQDEGFWTRSMLDPDHAPGRETSGTAFFTYGLLWGINENILIDPKFSQAALKGWHYLSEVSLQDDGRIGYVQPIGEKAIPGQVVDANSTAPFGVGAFLLAGTEMYRYLDKK